MQVLIVDVGERRETVKEWAAASGVTFPVLLDGDGVAARAWAPDWAQRDLQTWRPACELGVLSPTPGDEATAAACIDRREAHGERGRPPLI